MSVDEGMIKYKGRLYFRQYMPKKPIKYGIKVWMAADSRTGYVCNYDIFNSLLEHKSGNPFGLPCKHVETAS